MGDRELSDRQLDRIRASAEGNDVVFVLTYSEDGGMSAEGFHDGISTLEGLAFASFLRSYARDVENHTESQSMLGGEIDP